MATNNLLGTYKLGSVAVDLPPVIKIVIGSELHSKTLLVDESECSVEL